MSDEEVDYDVVFRTNDMKDGSPSFFCPSHGPGSAGSWWQAGSWGGGTRH